MHLVREVSRPQATLVSTEDLAQYFTSNDKYSHYGAIPQYRSNLSKVVSEIL